MNNFWKVIWVIAYLITAYYTFTGKMMVAMDWMAGTMLCESIVGLVLSITNKN
ncbi:hypothetical protein [uncultured Limosilactobacillus sp.]|uniref:hypothetical protein n=1 Tax=uncultured Limosilactobacillus sp. TaxID=2837629 RepID=UPI0025EB0AB3|nr:hypothetical protein [uncultured Limosilactobacillus sp.]